MSNLKVYNKIYKFSNENLSCYKNIYDFKDAKVFTVIGSGDQYFTSLLNGAKEVDVFDSNETAYYYFLLKFYSIKILSYEEFYTMFVLNRYFNSIIYAKLIKVLPDEVKAYYKYLINNKDNNTSSFLFDINKLDISKRGKYLNEPSIIPYLDKEKYYQLQEILNNTQAPIFNHLTIGKDKIEKEYDIILLSNIYDYLNINIFNYKKLLNSMNSSCIQAFYKWNEINEDDYKYLGFHVSRIEPSILTKIKNDYVISLRK